MAKAKRKTSRTAVKKTWFQITAPALFNKQTIGEMPLVEASKAMGRTVPVNLMNLTGDMRKQNINVIFEINNVTGSRLYTELVGYKMVASSIKRMVRRGKRKVDYSFTAKTSDGYKLKIKVIMVTLGLTYLSSLTGLRKACEEEVSKLLGKMKYEKFVDELVNHKVQTIVKKLVSKVYPLRMFEIRDMKVLKKGAEAPKVGKSQQTQDRQSRSESQQAEISSEAGTKKKASSKKVPAKPKKE
jgi:small subunit ribosomal protein S3Ae